MFEVESDSVEIKGCLNMITIKNKYDFEEEVFYFGLLNSGSTIHRELGIFRGKIIAITTKKDCSIWYTMYSSYIDDDGTKVDKRVTIVEKNVKKDLPKFKLSKLKKIYADKVFWGV